MIDETGEVAKLMVESVFDEVVELKIVATRLDQDVRGLNVLLLELNLDNFVKRLVLYLRFLTSELFAGFSSVKRQSFVFVSDCDAVAFFTTIALLVLQQNVLLLFI